MSLPFGLKVAKDLFGKMDSLQSEAAGTFDVPPLVKHLEHRGAKALLCPFGPKGHGEFAFLAGLEEGFKKGPFLRDYYKSW